MDDLTKFLRKIRKDKLRDMYVQATGERIQKRVSLIELAALMGQLLRSVDKRERETLWRMVLAEHANWKDACEEIGIARNAERLLAYLLRKPQERTPPVPLPAGVSPVIGIVADTHDDTEVIPALSKLLRDQRCDTVIHCGDFNRPDLLRRLVDGLGDIPLRWVEGNRDHTWFGKALGLPGYRIGEPGGEYGEFELGDHKIGVAHNPCHLPTDDGEELLLDWVDRCQLDWCFYGHYHMFNIRYRTASVRAHLVNPGGFYRDTKHTAVTVDLDAEEVSLFVRSNQRFTKVGVFELKSRRFHRAGGLREWRRHGDLEDKSDDLNDNWAVETWRLGLPLGPWLSHRKMQAGSSRV